MINQKPLLGETVQLKWDKKKHIGGWLIAYNKSSFWFWKNYFFIENNGSYDLLIDRMDFRFSLYRLKFLGLKKILDYQPKVKNVSLHSLEQDIGLPDILLKSSDTTIRKIKILNKKEKLSAKLNVPSTQLNISKLNP